MVDGLRSCADPFLVDLGPPTIEPGNFLAVSRYTSLAKV